ncbi:MAG TPA: dihydrolipoamide acetyltransferase family protein, partial [Steroidobacteraceae bacterium]|nr:dihydrolipoamide acetyltransferase family protein [Steroidobacteraceae bacterium]
PAIAPASASVVPAPASGTPPGTGEDVRVSPVARRLAQSLGVDLSRVVGTGRNGRVSKEDVENHVARLQAQGAGPRPVAGATLAPTTSGNPVTSIRMSALRSSIARRLLESKRTIPHYRLSIDVDIGRLRSRREALAASTGQKITLNDMLVRAAALALVKHPNVNSQFDGEEILQYEHADISVAVATETGLVTPIVRGADLLSIADISRATAELAQKAKAGTLVREDITGGTFTISNLGMFGVSQFDAIINPPQVAILAVGAASERVVARNGAPALTWMMTLTLSADHRVIDGAVGAAFLATLRDLLESAEEL